MDRTKNNTQIKKLSLIGYVGFVLSIATSSILLLVEPEGFDVRSMILPLIAVLFVSSLAFSYKIAFSSTSKILTIIGTISLAILFTIIGFSIVAGVAWLIALSHV